MAFRITRGGKGRGAAAPNLWQEEQVIWGVPRRSGLDEQDDPKAHAGLTQHAFEPGNDERAICGFEPPKRASSPTTKPRPQLAMPNPRLNPRCPKCLKLMAPAPTMATVEEAAVEPVADEENAAAELPPVERIGVTEQGAEATDGTVALAADPYSEPITELEAEPIAEVEAEPIAELDAEPIAELEFEPIAEREFEPIAQVEAQPITELEAEPIAELEFEPIAQVEAQPIAQVEAQPIAELEAEPIAELEAEPIAELEAEPIAELEAEPIAELEAEPIAEVVSEAVAIAALGELGASVAAPPAAPPVSPPTVPPPPPPLLHLPEVVSQPEPPTPPPAAPGPRAGVMPPMSMRSASWEGTAVFAAGQMTALVRPPSQPGMGVVASVISGPSGTRVGSVQINADGLAVISLGEPARGPVSVAWFAVPAVDENLRPGRP